MSASTRTPDAARATEFAVHGVDEFDSIEHDSVPDVYFTSGYGSAAATADGGTWHCAALGDRILMPYITSHSGNNSWDAASPYGYCGLYIAPSCTASEVKWFWNRLRAHWDEAGVVTAFLRFSPLDDESLESARALPSIALVQRGDTISVPVSEGPDAAWEQMEGRARTAVRKSERLGFTGTVHPVTPADISAAGPFRRVYEATMSRIGSSHKYFFSDDYYTRLKRGLGDDLLIAEVRSPDGGIAACSLVLAHRGRVHYHLAGSTPEGASMGANNMLVWTLVKWAAEHGKDTVHLGGGVSADDSLFRFKKSFGGRRAEFWTGAHIVDPKTYAELIGARAGQLGVSSQTLMASPFFPAHRLESISV